MSRKEHRSEKITKKDKRSKTATEDFASQDKRKILDEIGSEFKAKKRRKTSNRNDNKEVTHQDTMVESASSVAVDLSGANTLQESSSFTCESEKTHPGLIHNGWIRGEETRKKFGLKSGKWSKQEEKILKENLEKYLTQNNIDDPMKLMFAYQETEEGKEWKELAKTTGFYRELAKGINRSMFAVYRKALRSFDKNNYCGKFSEAEDKELLKLVALHGRKWVNIGGMMERSALSVVHRYYFMKDRLTRHHGTWQEDEVQRLKEAVRTLTSTRDGEEVYNGISWIAVASIVKTRNSKNCRQKWLDDICWKDCNLSSTVAKTWSQEDDVELITRIYESKTTQECDIDWQSISEGFEMARSPTWLSNKFATIKKKYCKSIDFESTDFEELVDYLHNIVSIDVQNKIFLNQHQS